MEDIKKREEIIDMLRNNLSKKFTQILATEASNSPKLVEHLISIMLTGGHPENWRAAWVLDHAAEINLNHIECHLPVLVNQLQTIKPDSLKRHITRMLVRSKRIDLIDGNVLNLSIDWLQSSTTPIAVRAFCMDIIDMISKEYPDIIPEFILVLEEIAINGSKGEKNKAQKLIKKYNCVTH
ncbi:MAG: hypothetical protein JW717_01635 [Marinilabiliaceae bacterium]|nr:hypothetical protein [Marinilabiliaceae bacterium]